MLSTARSAEVAAAFDAEARQRLRSAYETGVRDAAVESPLARLSWRRDPAKTLVWAQAELEHSAISPAEKHRAAAEELQRLLPDPDSLPPSSAD